MRTLTKVADPQSVSVDVMTSSKPKQRYVHIKNTQKNQNFILRRAVTIYGVYQVYELETTRKPNGHGQLLVTGRIVVNVAVSLEQMSPEPIVVR